MKKRRIIISVVKESALFFSRVIILSGGIIGMFVFMYPSICYAQTLCDRKAVIPNTTFNQCNNDPWVLVFEDNFDGNTFDFSRWELQQWAQGALYGNGGKTQEYNTLDNVEVSDGILKIIAKKETVQRRAISWKPDNEILSDGLPNLRTYPKVYIYYICSTVKMEAL